MKMKTKLLFTVTAALLAGSLMTGCGGGSGTNTDYDYYDRSGNGYNDEDVDWDADGDGIGWDQAVDDWNRANGY